MSKVDAIKISFAGNEEKYIVKSPLSREERGLRVSMGIYESVCS